MKLLMLWLFFATWGFAKAPNIVLIMTDDQGFPPVGASGHPWIHTPNMDKLHDTSVVFDHFLVSPTCAPTRSAIMSGRHPLKNGVTHTILERERMALSTVTLPQVLAKGGYKSGIFGKWHLGDEDEYQPGARGFDEVFIHGAGGIGQSYPGSCADVPKNSYFNPIIRHNGKFVKTKGFCTDVFFNKATNWISQVKDADEPFFVYLSTNAPHGPYLAPDKYTKRFLDMGYTKAHAGFYGMVENIDDNLGNLMAKMDEWDLWKDTVFIFMSDNGMTGGVGQEGQVIGIDKDGKKMKAYNAGLKGQKGSSHEGGVKVPFYLRWDGHTKAGKTVPQIVAHIDLLPTFAGLAGVAYPKDQVEGRDFWPLVTGTGEDWQDRFLFTHVARWPTGAEPNDFQWKDFAVRSDRYRLVGKNTLYDMANDPGQKKNIIADHPEVAKEMIAAYDKFWKEARPLMVNEDKPLSKTQPYPEHYRAQMAKGGIPDDE